MIADELMKSDVVAVFNKYRKGLQIVYKYYCNITAIDRSSVPWSQIEQHNSMIHLAEFMKFCQDFDIVPSKLSHDEVISVSS